MFKFLHKKRKYKDYSINPDEIFMDTLNVSELDQQQFEGVMETPIALRSMFILTGIFAFVGIIFLGQLFSLQIIHGDEFLKKSEKNTLRSRPIFAERGIIYDRNQTELAWNEARDESDFLYRKYISQSGFGHILGYVNYPQKDNHGVYWRKEISGQAGLEKKYNDILSGTNGSQLYEVDAQGNILSKNNIREGKKGGNLVTTIDAQLQHLLFEAIKKQAKEHNFVAGSGGIMDIRNGELLALVSYPEYDPYTLAEGKDIERIHSFFQAKNKPFLNRVVSGLYSPGSIVKPFLALAALHEGIIDEHTTILSTGGIKVPNKYNPSKSSIFKDWKHGGHGITDVKKAIAESVNTFFYAIGGGYKNQKGLGIFKIDTYLKDFGIAQKTGIDFGREFNGIIPSPEWKKKNYQDGIWRLGDTYITSIGQFGFQVSPLQMLRSVAALANGGTLWKPLLVLGNAPISEKITPSIDGRDYEIVREGMRKTVTSGTARNINVSFMDFAAKTGTAQVGARNEFYNSWILGFFPAHKPKYAFVIAMEKGEKGKSGSASNAMRTFIDSIEQEYPEFWESVKND